MVGSTGPEGQSPWVHRDRGSQREAGAAPPRLSSGIVSCLDGGLHCREKSGAHCLRTSGYICVHYDTKCKLSPVSMEGSSVG